MGFAWPLGRTWHGYENPWPGPVSCPTCLATGLNEPSQRLYRQFRSWAPKMTLAEEALLLESGVTKPEIMKVRRRQKGFDTPIIRFQLTEIRAKRRGVWGPCPTCNGDQLVPNPNPAVVALYAGVNLFEEWSPVEPPSGSGWQLWENPAPEGCPVSPVFETAEQLAEWCAENFTAPYEEWLAWLHDSGNEPPDSSPPLRLQSEHFQVYLRPKGAKPH